MAEVEHQQQQHQGEDVVRDDVPKQEVGDPNTRAKKPLVAASKPTVLRPRVYLSFPHNTEVPPNVLPGSLRMHPRGFRLLKGTSPLERRMHTYFRLPPRPPKKAVDERFAVLREVSRVFPPPGQSAVGTHRVSLDGFILIEACGVQDPADAKECILSDSNLCGSAHEDLPFFTGLKFLDLGENSMELADLRRLPALEELHLHCNGIKTLRLTKPKPRNATQRQGGKPLTKDSGVGGGPDDENMVDDDVAEDEDDDDDVEDPFGTLTTLNLSFNRIPYRELIQLSLLRSLERVDLSSNNLRKLPSDLSSLVNVTQLALENNKLSDPNVFFALSTMPSLTEVNLNFNQFTSVPRFSMDDGQGVCFPLLRVMGLASNEMEFFEDVFALSQLTTLRRLVLWGNPVERRMKDCQILIYEFGALNVQVVLESPVPPKRHVGEFYSANTRNFVQVTTSELRPVPKTKGGATQLGSKKPHTAPASTTAGGDGSPSFFVTQVGLERGGDDTATDADGLPTAEDASRGVRRTNPSATSPMDGGDGGDAWFSSTPNDDALDSAGGGGQRHRGGGRLQGLAPSSGATRRVERDDDGGHDTAVDGGQWASSPGRRFDDGVTGAFDHGRDDICRPNANVRAVMTELKRMLRQPLPPIHTQTFEQSTVSSRNNKKR